MKKKQNQKTENFLYRNLLMSADYIMKSRNFIYSVILIFFVFALIAFFVPAPQNLTDTIMNFLKELLNQTQNLSYPELISFIFVNNLKSSFFGMTLGFFLGIFPVAVAISNGYLLGFVSALSANNNGIFSLWRILPHGIFELPAVFISLGLGIKLGTFIFKKNKLETFREFFSESLRTFFFVVVPLLFVAAIIEGTLIFFFK